MEGPYCNPGGGDPNNIPGCHERGVGCLSYGAEPAYFGQMGQCSTCDPEWACVSIAPGGNDGPLDADVSLTKADLQNRGRGDKALDSIRLSESELVNLISRVISEKELKGSKRYREDTCRCYWMDGSSNSVMCEGKGSGCGSLTEGYECDECCRAHGMVAYNPTLNYGSAINEDDETGKLGTELPADSPFPKGSTPPHKISQHTPMSHDEFMDGLHDLCPTITGPEKRVGNRSCGRCHGEIMTLLKRYCKSI